MGIGRPRQSSRRQLWGVSGSGGGSVRSSRVGSFDRGRNR